MYSSTSDLAIALVAGKVINDYVNSEVLFYPVGSAISSAISEFTVGAWLECAWRLRAANLAPAQAAELAMTKTAVDTARSEAQPMYEAKVRREFKSRLDSFGWYLDGGQGGPGSYATPAHGRLKLELLKADVAQPELELLRLEGVDSRLRSRFASGTFIFEPELAPSAPRDVMWWLYGTIRPASGS